MNVRHHSGPTQLASEPARGTAVPRWGRYDGSHGPLLSGFLAAECRLGPARDGAILRPGAGDRVDVVALYPQPNEDGNPPAWLDPAAALAHESIRMNRATATEWTSDDPPGEHALQHIVSIPFTLAEAPPAAAVFLVHAAGEAALRTVQERLELGVSLLTLSQSRQPLQKKELDLRRLRQALETLAALNRHRRFGSTAMAFCNELASQWQCDRVSLGLLQGRYIHVKALSHTESFSRKMQFVQDLESAMEECLDQDCEVIYPASADSTCIDRAAGELSKRHGPLALVSLPIRDGAKGWGVVTLERPVDQPFTAEEIESVRLALELCTAWLVAVRQQDRWLGAKMATRLKNSLTPIVGPRHTWVKMLTLVVLTAIAFLVFAKGDYRAEASFVLEGIERQIVPAPFDGYIKTVNVEVGDSVTAHETSLAELDTAELRLKLAESRAEKAGYLKQMAAAMRDGQTAQAQIAEANAEKAQAQIDLLEYRIAQANLISPLDGTIVAGDLKRRIGAPVKTGDVLFQVTPLHSLRAVLHVAEDQITDVRVGQRGYLATASYPGRRIAFEVERINPIAEVVKQQNILKVRVRLLEVDPWMRPGMEGVARITIDERPYAWIWTRKLTNWIRMKLWL